MALKRKRRTSSIFRTVLVFAATVIIGVYAACVLALVALRFIAPPSTMVQAQRYLEAWAHHRHYQKRYTFVPLARISPEFQHAVIAAEDGRFYQHNGIDWKEVQKVVDKDVEEGHLGRGGSTITQQLVKNLFFTTNRSIVRKAVEFTLAPTAEVILPKRRILELYLNVVEWGQGIYGAEAAAHAWYGISAARVNREQGARLAALLPSPLRRKPDRMNTYSAEIQRRMTQMGW